MIKTVWVFLVVSLQPYTSAQIVELKRFPTITECQEYADDQVYIRDRAVGCLPALVRDGSARLSE